MTTAQPTIRARIAAYLATPEGELLQPPSLTREEWATLMLKIPPDEKSSPTWSNELRDWL